MKLNDMFERTLILSPHFDDETIGCSGLLRKLKQDGKSVLVVVMCTYVNNIERTRIRIDEFYNVMAMLGVDKSETLILEGYNDGEAEFNSKKKLITLLDRLMYDYKPTAVLFPCPSHHQDHQFLNTCCIASLRPTVDKNFIKLKAMYEYPYVGSWGPSTMPTGRMYVELSKEELEMKRESLKEYKSQLIRDSRDILDESSIVDFARMRGREIGAYAAEAYYPLQITIE